MNHPVFAGLYDRRSVAEERLQSDHRRELVDGLSGRAESVTRIPLGVVAPHILSRASAPAPG